MQGTLCCCNGIGGRAGAFQVGTNKYASVSVSARRLLCRRSVILRRIAASATPTPENSTVDYNSSSTSVFPAEACDTIGGEACDGKIFPEAKPPAAAATTTVGSEEVDRDYLEYDEPKTVFPGEACDDLGGEFCEPEYQKGVYREKALL